MSDDEWVEVPVYMTVGMGEPFQIGTATGPRGRTWTVADTAEFLESMARGFRRELLGGEEEAP